MSRSRTVWSQGVFWLKFLVSHVHQRVELHETVVGVALDQQVFPHVGHVLAVVVAGKQFVDQLGALVGVVAVEERGGLIGGRDVAGEVEVDAAEEFGVVGRAARR